MSLILDRGDNRRPNYILNFKKLKFKNELKIVNLKTINVEI